VLVYYSCTVQAAFLVSATYAGRSPLGGPSSSASTPIRRLLPIAAAPTALAGVAVAFAFGHTHAAAPSLADAAVHHSTASTATSGTDASSAQLLSLTHQPGVAAPVVRLNAARMAAIQPKGKHHQTQPQGKHHSTLQTEYVVKSGDTLASIAQHLYHGADYWPALYSANHSAIKYANDIQVGQVLKVPAKPAKIPSAPTVLAPTAAPSTTSTTAQATSTVSEGQSDSSASTAGTESTDTGSTSSFQACVIAAESGGNAQVTNSSGHYGLYQFSASTWAEYGGDPAEFGDATVAEQNQVFDNAIAAGGESNWSLYDGC
jgi:LysM repeat protein